METLKYVCAGGLIFCITVIVNCELFVTSMSIVFCSLIITTIIK